MPGRRAGVAAGVRVPGNDPALTRAATGAALLLLACAPAFAGQITLQLTSTAQLRGDVLAVDLIVVNSGDETAFALRPSLALHERELFGASRVSLAPGATLETSLALAVPGLGPGRWPFLLAVDYADARQHPFQVLQAATIDRGGTAPASLEVLSLETQPVAARGSATLRLKNAGGVARQARVTLVVPRDVDVEPRRDVVLRAGETRNARFALFPRTALPNSRYPVFALVEYDEDGVHQALVRQAALDIAERRPELARVLFAASAVLLVCWGALLLRRRGSTSAG